MVSIRRTKSRRSFASPGGGEAAVRGKQATEEFVGNPTPLAQTDRILDFAAVESLLKRVAVMAVDEMASRRSRLDLIPGVRLASERELAKYVPWTAKEIRSKRESGLLKPMKAPATGKGQGEYWYNLYDVWALLNQQSPGWRPGVRRIPDDLEVKLS